VKSIASPGRLVRPAFVVSVGHEALHVQEEGFDVIIARHAYRRAVAVLHIEPAKLGGAHIAPLEAVNRPKIRTLAVATAEPDLPETLPIEGRALRRRRIARHVRALDRLGNVGLGRREYADKATVDDRGIQVSGELRSAPADGIAYVAFAHVAIVLFHHARRGMT
jgi:hypothetical protein